MRISTEIMERNGVEVDTIRAVDHDLAPGVWSMTFMTWNLLHIARMLKDSGGTPAAGSTSRIRTTASI